MCQSSSILRYLVSYLYIDIHSTYMQNFSSNLLYCEGMESGFNNLRNGCPQSYKRRKWNFATELLLMDGQPPDSTPCVITKDPPLFWWDLDSMSSVDMLVHHGEVSLNHSRPWYLNLRLSSASKLYAFISIYWRKLNCYAFKIKTHYMLCITTI